MARSGIVLLLAACVVASPAAARQAGEPFTDLMNMATHSLPAHQAAATAMSPSVRLPPSAPKWIAAEAARQAASPRSVARVALDIDEQLERDIRKTARRQNIHPQDITSAVLLSVMYGANETLIRQFPGAAAQEPQAAARLAQARANLEAVMPLQSQVSLQLAMAQ